MKIFLPHYLDREEMLSEIKIHLKRGGLIVYPTDTLYGIGCDFFSKDAQNKIDLIKGRSGSPYSVIISNSFMFEDLTETDEKTQFFYDRLFPGKVTLITRISKNIDKDLVKGVASIGLRIPDVPMITNMVNFINIPLISTSVNRSGENPMYKINDIKEFFSTLQENLEIILIDAGDLPQSEGSTILDISTDIPKIAREGDEIDKVKHMIREYSRR